MPPLPKPKTGAARGSRKSTAGTRERAGTRESSSAPPTGTTRSRTTRATVTKEQVARMYMMMGTMVMPFGRFYPVLGPVGENLRNLADEAADAWMELAAKDKRVLEILESIVGASTWGNVIGIHLAIFASALPMGNYLQQVTDVSSVDDIMSEYFKTGRAAGMSDEEIVEAAKQAGVPVDMPAQDKSTGGPGDTIRVSEQPVAEPVPRSGIVTAEQLGAQNSDEDGVFPHDPSPPNGSGV